MRRWREAAGVRRSHSMLAGMDSAELSQLWKTLERFPNRLQLFPGDQNDVFHRALPENAALSSAHRGLINDTKSFLPEPWEFYWEPRRTYCYLSPLLPPLDHSFQFIQAIYLFVGMESSRQHYQPTRDYMHKEKLTSLSKECP